MSKVSVDNNVRILSEKILSNTTMMVVSDIHYYSSKKQRHVLDAILAAVYRYHPKYVLIPGDIFDSTDVFGDPEEMQYFMNWLDKLCKLTTVFAIKGDNDIMRQNENGDWVDQTAYAKKMFDRYFNDISDRNFILTDNKTIEIPEDGLTISGIEQSFAWFEKYGENARMAVNEFNSFVRKGSFSQNMEHIGIAHSNSGLLENGQVVGPDYVPFMPFSGIVCEHKHGGGIGSGTAGKIATAFGDIRTHGEFSAKKMGLLNPQHEKFPTDCYGTHYGIKSDEHPTTIVTSRGITKLNKSLGAISHFNGLCKPNIDLVTVERVTPSKIEELRTIMKEKLAKIPKEQLSKFTAEELREISEEGLKPEEKVFVKRLKMVA